MPASKTAKHKESNKHRFLSFSERISQVSIDAIHRIKRADEIDKDEDSRFRTCLIKWRDQDRSLQFQEFLSEIASKSQNFKMVVHYIGEIVSSLLKHLAVLDSLALQALCELIVSLCIDLRSEFYPYFRETFTILTKLMNTKNVERLEWIFNAISLVFKYLWKYMVADMDSILSLYKDLMSGEHPSHIATFAAESITFLIRKASSQEGFFRRLFDALATTEKSSQGLGKILFHVMKGVNRTLYSRTEVILPQLLSCFSEEGLPISHVFESINSALALLANHVQKDHSKIVWDIILSTLQNNNVSPKSFVLKLTDTWCSHGNGVLIMEPEKLANTLEDLCANCDTKVIMDTLEICESLILVKKENFPESFKIKLIGNVVNSRSFPAELLLAFWRKVLVFVNHNTDARRMMLKFCQIQISTDRNGVLHLLSNYIISNSSLPNDAKELLEYKPFHIDYILISRDDGVTKIQDSLKQTLQDENVESSVLWMSLLSLQHIRPSPVTPQKMMSNLLERLFSAFEKNNSPAPTLAVIRMLMETAIILDNGKKQKKILTLCLSCLKFLLSIYADGDIQERNTLFILDIITTVNQDAISEIQNHPDLIKNISSNLSSSDAIVRKFSLRILTALHPDNHIFKTCLHVEESPACIQTYRTKVLFLGKLKYSPDISPEVASATLRFLVSNLYINFSSYWPQVQEKVVSFMPQDGGNLLWTLLFDLLEAASKTAELMQSDEKTNKGIEVESPLVTPIEELFFENGVKVSFLTQANIKVDHFNYRNLLWKTLSLLPVEILERNNRRIVTLFLNYLENEYFKIDKSYAPHQNLLSKTQKKSNAKVFGKNHSIKTLNVYLHVLSKFKNSVSCFSAAKLKSIYEDLLMHGDCEVQKSVLKCLLRFKDKNLAAFEEQLFALLDDEKIKETMVQFNLAEIEASKRESLIPVLFRLMYGRMISKAGIGGQTRRRRATVIRFLSGLKENEMQAFVFLAIKPIKHYVNEDMLNSSLDKKFNIGFDLSEVVPLSRQHGILNTVSEIVAKHANLLSKFMCDYLLKFLLSLHLSYCRMIDGIESSEDPSSFQHTLSFLRNLCKQAHSTVNMLFESWPESDILSKEQIESIFFVLVDPHIHKLHHECISQPTALLNLFNEFSKQPKFVPILGQKTTAENINSPIQAIITTLVSEKTSSAVTKFIMEILVRLLGNKEDSGTLESPEEPMIADTLANINSDIISAKEIAISNIGLELMVNFVGEILKYFINKLKNKKNSTVLIQSHLELLISLGEHITDIDLSNELTELLLSHISSASRAGRTVTTGTTSKEKSIYPALTALAAIPLSCSFLPSITKLFSRIKSRLCRLVLIQVFKKACGDTKGKFAETTKKVCSIIAELNAWDKRFIEEIDFDSRLTGFQELNNWLKNGSVESLLEEDYCGLLSLVQNSIFTLENHGDDLSLREMSSRSLEKVIGLAFRYSADYLDFYQTVISAVFLPAIRRGLNSGDENQRHEWLRLLVKIAKLAPTDNAFSILKILCNDTDQDADFFCNVQHIQLHRRTRAFRKLAQVISNTEDSENTISYTMVTNYLLPLAIQTIKCKDLTKHLHLRDACLDVVSACAKIMPWSSYVRFLRQNMALIMRHAQGVKIVCSILYAFHFDIASISEEKAFLLEESFISMKARSKEKVEEGDGVDTESEMKQELSLPKEETDTIYRSVVCDILPRLCESLSAKLDSDSSHKLADSQNFSDIDNCTIRAPLAVAVVSLLRKLPGRILDRHLPTVLLKIVAFLRHHYNEVRSAASKVMVQIAQLLDPVHLTVILRELKSGLTRGYQKHVLIHTTNCILSQMEAHLNIGDLEKCSGLVRGVLNDDLFGKGEEERGVEKIKSKIPEARGRSKAYNVYKILAKFSKKESLLSIILPFKNILDSTHDHKKRKIVESVLQEINHGLQENTALTAEDILIFLHGLLTENLPGIFDSKISIQEKERKKTKKGFRPDSCYLLSTEPERYGVKETKKSQKTNLHLLIEFSLELLNSSLKRQTINLTKTEHLQMIDPFVKILNHCLNSAHSRTVTEAIRCLTKLLKSSLPSLQENAVDIIKGFFKVLRENSSGSTNNELAAATYKALSILCNGDLGSKLTDTQLQVLLGYAEEMLYERDRQSHAFNVIQSILSRGLNCDEVVDVINKIRDICIQTHDSAAMVHARQVYMYFLNHYPMTRTKLFRHLEFVLAQLSFEYESGRISSLELLGSIINSFPEALVKSSSGTIFVPLSAMLLNDESVKCRKLAGHVIQILLNKLQAEDKDQLFSLVLQWYRDEEHLLHQQLAAMLIAIFAEVEVDAFRRNLPELFPTMSKVLASVVERYGEEKEDQDTESPQRDDHFIFHQLSAFHTVLRTCKLMRGTSWEKQVSALLYHVEALLLHPHMWVRIAASQVFGTVFASWDPKELADSHCVEESQYFKDVNARKRILSARFCQQIKSPILDPKLAEQCIKNLLFIVRVHAAAGAPKNAMNSNVNGDSDSDSEQLSFKKDPISILFSRLLKTAKQEAANSIKETSKRTAILKFYAAACLGLDDIEDYLSIIIELIYRETERKIVEENEEAMALKTLAGQVLEVVKNKVGSNFFMDTYACVRKQITTGRRERKRKKDVALVADPQRAAASKRHRQQKKKEQRKRKIASFKPEYGAKLNKRKKKTLIADL